MDFDEVVTWLMAKFGNDSQARIVVLSRTNDPSTGQRKECSVIDVSFDESDSEISLLVNQLHEDHQTAEPLTVASLLAKLRVLPPSCKTSHFVSGTWTELDDEHNARIDWPFDGIATNEDDSCVAFVERVLADRGNSSSI
jgi:hypothetical protein